jgi:hypothetical protein
MRLVVPGSHRALIPKMVALLCLAGPCLANGQSFVLHGAGDPTVNDRGYSLAAGIGFSPTSGTLSSAFVKSMIPHQSIPSTAPKVTITDARGRRNHQIPRS